MLGNRQLHREKDVTYKWDAHLITRANPYPVILVGEQCSNINVSHTTQSWGNYEGPASAAINTQTKDKPTTPNVINRVDGFVKCFLTAYTEST